MLNRTKNLVLILIAILFANSCSFTKWFRRGGHGHREYYTYANLRPLKHYQHCLLEHGVAKDELTKGMVKGRYSSVIFSKYGYIYVEEIKFEIVNSNGHLHKIFPDCIPVAIKLSNDEFASKNTHTMDREKFGWFDSKSNYLYFMSTNVFPPMDIVIIHRGSRRKVDHRAY
jgi:hypothetical protein